jgi:hypothetical protein
MGDGSGGWSPDLSTTRAVSPGQRQGVGWEGGAAVSVDTLAGPPRGAAAVHARLRPLVRMPRRGRPPFAPASAAGWLMAFCPRTTVPSSSSAPSVMRSSVQMEGSTWEWGGGAQQRSRLSACSAGLDARGGGAAERRARAAPARAGGSHDGALGDACHAAEEEDGGLEGAEEGARPCKKEVACGRGEGGAGQGRKVASGCGSGLWAAAALLLPSARCCQPRSRAAGGRPAPHLCCRLRS